MGQCRFCGEGVAAADKFNHERQCHMGRSCPGCAQRFSKEEIAGHQLHCLELQMRRQHRLDPKQEQGAHSTTAAEGTEAPRRDPKQQWRENRQRDTYGQSSSRPRSQQSRQQPQHGSAKAGERVFKPPPRQAQKLSKAAEAVAASIRGQLAGLDPEARKKALRALQRYYHPDKNPGSEKDVAEIFQYVQTLWDAEFR